MIVLLLRKLYLPKLLKYTKFIDNEFVNITNNNWNNLNNKNKEDKQIANRDSIKFVEDNKKIKLSSVCNGIIEEVNSNMMKNLIKLLKILNLGFVLDKHPEHNEERILERLRTRKINNVWVFGLMIMEICCYWGYRIINSAQVLKRDLDSTHQQTKEVSFRLYKYLKIH